MYFILPETEKRSLEDIELHYADNTKKITDIHIRISRKCDDRNKNIEKQWNTQFVRNNISKAFCLDKMTKLTQKDVNI